MYQGTMDFVGLWYSLIMDPNVQLKRSTVPQRNKHILVLSSSAGLVMVICKSKQYMSYTNVGFLGSTYFLSTPNERYSIINTNTVHMHNLPSDDG